MKDTLFKFKILYWLLLEHYEHWRKEIWNRDLDEVWCCSGRECACGGETVRTIWTQTAGVAALPELEE